MPVPACELVSHYDGRTYRVDAIELQVHPVTAGTYARFLKATGRAAPFGWSGALPPGDPDAPVVHVTLDDARACAAWLGLRLPTQVEWEAGMRGGDDRRFPWGSEWDPARCHCRAGGASGLCRIGQLPQGASPVGCQDLVGNVWEWTEPHPDSPLPRQEGCAWVYGGSYRHHCVQRTFTAAGELVDAFAIRTNCTTTSDYGYLGFRCARG